MSATLQDSQLARRLALTADELAESMGVSRKTVWNHTAPRGSLKPIRIGTAVRYSIQEVERWLSERQSEGYAK